MNMTQPTIARRLSFGFAAVLASTLTLGTVLALFANAGNLGQGAHHLPGGAGLAERYRAMQPTANDQLLAPRAGVTDLRVRPNV